MATIVKRKLSCSTDGLAIKISGNAAASAATVHVAVAGTTAGTFDEIWLYGYNGHTDSVALTIQFGGTASENLIVSTLASKSGLLLLVPGWVLQNAKTVTAFAGTADVIALSGFVNSITD